MSDFLYIIYKKYSKDDPAYDFKKTIKIGSTENFIKRMSNYVTPEAYFNNYTHDIYCIKITKSKWTCYELDKIVQHVSIKYSIPYQKLTLNDGGIEHCKDTKTIIDKSIIIGPVFWGIFILTRHN